MSDPLYLVEKFGLQNPWVLWRLARGGLDGYCETCRGEGVVVRSPCENREPDSLISCSLREGCVECRVTCGACKGSRLRTPEPLHVEDFGDEASLEVARLVLGEFELALRPRIDRNPRAL